jgi:hydroxyacylglutathione hydrolase
MPEAAAIEIVPVPVLSDNYVWLMHDAASGETVVIDPAVADPVLAAADARGWRITQIWNTHWHPDHLGGNAGIKAATGATITGPAAEADKIGTLDRTVSEGDRVAIGGITGDVIAVGAHTAGHIAIHLPQAGAVFTGDTMFKMGCGRLFEGTPEDMYAAMRKLDRLPGETRVYCAHEYTVGNGRYAVVAEPANADTRAALADAERLRAAGLPTLPTTIAAERATNPFLRARNAAELGERRAAKDEFKG